MFSVVEGKRKWYWAWTTSPSGVYGGLAVPGERRLPDGTDLAREGRVRLQRVGVGAHVDDLAEPRMRRRAVVALEEVLQDDLPVRLDRPLVMRVEADRVEVEAALRDDLGKPPERSRERRRLGVRVHEDERPPRAHGDRCERQPVRAEPGLALRPRRLAQRPVEVVRPRVVRALQRLAAARSLDDEVAAVPADVDEPAEHSVRSPDDRDGDVPDVRGEVRPRLG